MSAPSQTTFYNRKNNAVSTIADNPLTDSATTINVATGEGALFPSSGTWLATIWDNTTYANDPSSDPNMEVVLVSSRSSDALTVTRAQSGTSNVQHASGSTIALLVMDEALDQHETAINDLEAVAYQTGWVAMGVTLTYSSVDDPTGVVTSSSDISDKLSVGMRIKFTNNSVTVYGIVTAISGTTITFLHEIDPTDSQALNLMQNSAITSPFFSFHKCPYGFPVDSRKWMIRVSDTTSRITTNPVQNTWNNISQLGITLPIGVWDVSYQAMILVQDTSATSGELVACNVTLSTANNTESDVELTSGILIEAAPNSDTDVSLASMCNKHKIIVITTKTAYYFNVQSTAASATNAGTYVASGQPVVRALLTYL